VPLALTPSEESELQEKGSITAPDFPNNSNSNISLIIMDIFGEFKKALFIYREAYTLNRHQACNWKWKRNNYFFRRCFRHFFISQTSGFRARKENVEVFNP
jgi:hypothetical protein